MSTIILNAFKFNGKASDLMERVRNYRFKWHEFQINRIKKHVDLNRNFLDLVDEIKKQSTALHPTWSDMLDVRGSIVAYFHKNSIYAQTFLQCIEDPPKFIDDRFVDFHYQNQSDPWYSYEETLSRKDKAKAIRNWKVREKVWNEIYSDNFNTPSQAGFYYELCQNYDYYTIARGILDFAKRV